jgi:hypothetical protein
MGLKITLIHRTEKTDRPPMSNIGGNKCAADNSGVHIYYVNYQSQSSYIYFEPPVLSTTYNQIFNYINLCYQVTNFNYKLDV